MFVDVGPNPLEASRGEAGSLADADDAESRANMYVNRLVDLLSNSERQEDSSNGEMGRFLDDDGDGYSSVGKSMASSAARCTVAERFSARRRDLVQGRFEWVNISNVVRQTFKELIDVTSKQAVEIRNLKVSLKNAREEISHRPEDKQVREVTRTLENRLDRFFEKLQDMEQELELKADASYVTNGLLTKANKSEIAGRRFTTQIQTEHSIAVSERYELKEYEMRQELERFRRAIEEQIKDVLKQVEIQRVGVEHHRQKVEDVCSEKVGLLGRQLKKELKQLQKKMHGFPLSPEPGSPAHVGFESKNSREINDLVKQVEKLAAVQSASQSLLLQLEDRLGQTITRGDLEKAMAEKSNKVSVANAIHRKANKTDIEKSLEEINARLLELESSLQAQSTKLPPKKKRANKDDENTKKHIDDVWNFIEQDLPTKDQVGSAMDKLHEKLAGELDQLRLLIEKMSMGDKKGPLGSSNVDALEGRIRAVTENCATTYNAVKLLKEDVRRLDERINVAVTSSTPNTEGSVSSSSKSGESEMEGSPKQPKPKKKKKIIATKPKTQAPPPLPPRKTNVYTAPKK
mmetsp:Transcript_23223/g.36944  ORF Transcript_23223/g.36944 Transcript_23223/m.36944 type:complete len:575 (-) Transcript_23223:1024-2748(-)